MTTLLSWIVETVPAGDRLRLIRPIGRGGFMILIALIAVALGSLLMVSTAPDLSGTATSLKYRELSQSLGALRRAVRARPLFLTRTDFKYRMPSGEVRAYCAGDFYSPDALQAALGQLVFIEQLKGQASFPANTRFFSTPEQAALWPLSSTASFLTTIPVDPTISPSEWYNPSGNPSGLFWGASYNTVKDPTYASGTAIETYVAESLWIYYPKKSAEGNLEIWRCDRFGQNAGQILFYKGADHSDLAVSPDGSRLAFIRKTGSEANVVVASDDGSQEIQVTNSGGLTVPQYPLWSPGGDKLVFVRSRPSVAYSSTLMMTSATGANPTTITAGLWSDLDIPPTYDWSPDGRFIAYAYKRSGMARHHLALFNAVDRLHLIPPNEFSDSAELSETCPLSFSPSSNDLLYATFGGTELWTLSNLRAYPLTQRKQVAVSSLGPFQWAGWIPDTLKPASNVTSRWIMYAGGADRATARAPYLARKKVDDSTESFVISRVNPIEPSSVSLSSYGSLVTYRSTSTTGSAVYMDCIDGSRGRTVVEVGLNVPVQKAPFGATRDFWVIPPGNAQVASSATRASFDMNGWRALTNREADFDGDNRFGFAYLRVLPPGRQRHFLIDNGTDSFMIQDDPAQRGKDHPILKTFLGNTTPTWSPRGLTFIGRKSMSAAGEPPLECFKAAIDVSATTVLVTTGYDPALCPDDKWVAVSRPMDAVTTDAPPHTGYPILNMDLWIANSVGAPEPVPVHLTADTPKAQERCPAWSPDGRYIYYQRETQEGNSFLGNHNSTIYRITASGGADTEVVGNSQVSPFWNTSNAYHSRVECYSPAVSPDGLRLAFIGRERILDSFGAFRSGDVISEILYVKDLLYNREPVPVLRSANPKSPTKPPGSDDNNNRSFSSLSWSPDGEEIFVVRSKPMNTRFPEYTNDSHRKGLTVPDYVPEATDIVRVIPKAPIVSENGTKGLSIGTGFIDPANDGFRVIVDDSRIVGFSAGSRILSARYSNGAYVYQRITSDRPILQGQGISMDTWYALSAYVRTSSSSSHHHQAQLMTQLFNNRGLLIPQVKDSLVFQSGLSDTGGSQWNRYSAAIRFDSGLLSDFDQPPYTVNLCLYSFCLEVGSEVDIACVKLEKAYDQELRYPTAFGPDWTLFSVCKDPDPTRPGYYLFER